MEEHKIKFVFFGTEPLAGNVLSSLESAGYIPSLIVAAPDKKDTRKDLLVPPVEKVWALARGIPVLQPEKIDEAFTADL